MAHNAAPSDSVPLPTPAALAAQIKEWGRALGFSDIAITDVDLSFAEEGLLAWLAQGWHGEMDYMARHGVLRARPATLVPGVVRAIVARLDYASVAQHESVEALADHGRAYISRYALGRDYHKVMRRKLQNLADRLEASVGPLVYRAFSDSAPILEVELAARAGLGWRGKHTLLLSRDAGSYYFLGELLVGLDIAVDAPVSAHCGSCRRCLDACPTQAIVAPYRLDARRCISYLTIEHSGAIPVELRAAMGNRIYGCDDCQLVCPWNRYAQPTLELDFAPRHGLERITLLELAQWDARTFGERFAGSAILRIGFERWQRNVAVALGNWRRSQGLGEAVSLLVTQTLQEMRNHASPLVCEHIDWALADD
jgi:epoxyqueuosine reductase